MISRLPILRYILFRVQILYTLIKLSRMSRDQYALMKVRRVLRLGISPVQLPAWMSLLCSSLKAFSSVTAVISALSVLSSCSNTA